MNRISLLLLCILFICLICVYNSNSNKEHFKDYIDDYSFSKRFDGHGHYHTDFLDRATPGRLSEDPKVITYWVPTSNEDDGKILPKIMYDTKYKVSSDLVDDPNLKYTLLKAPHDEQDAELINRKCATGCDTITPSFDGSDEDEDYDESIRDVIKNRFNFRESTIKSQDGEQPDIITSITIEPKRAFSDGSKGPIQWHPWSGSSLDKKQESTWGNVIPHDKAMGGGESEKKEFLRRVKFYDNIFNRWASKYPEHIQKDLQHKYKLYNLVRDRDISIPVNEILLEPLETVKSKVIKELNDENAESDVNQLLSTTDTSLKRDFILCRKELGLCIDNDQSRSYDINRGACTSGDASLNFIKNKYLEDENDEGTYCDILHSDKLKISKGDGGEIKSANIVIDNCPNKYINQALVDSDIDSSNALELLQLQMIDAFEDLSKDNAVVKHTEKCGSNSD